MVLDIVKRHGNWYIVHRRKNGTFYKKKWEKLENGDITAMGSFTINAAPFGFGDQRFNLQNEGNAAWFRLNMNVHHSMTTAPMPTWNNQEPLPNESPEPNERNVYLQMSLDRFMLSPQRFRNNQETEEDEEE